MTHGVTRQDGDDHHQTADRPDELRSRLEAVERTVTGTDTDVFSLEDVAAIEARISALESTVETLTDRLDDVDAATQAVRGYVGGVRAVNEDVERRANAALAKAESLESALVDESETEFQSMSAGTTQADLSDTTHPRDEGPTHRLDDQSPADDSDRGLTARLRDVL